MEVLIVLTVTAATFISFATIFTGKQGQTETSQSVRALESKVQNVTSDVGAGYYRTSEGFNCQPNAAGVFFPINGDDPGSNKGCIFLGKVMSFNRNDTNIITVVGRQYLVGTTDTDVKNRGEARPTSVVAPVDITENYVYPHSMRVMSVRPVNSVGVFLSAIGIFSELGGGVSEGNPVTGSRSVELIGVVGTVSAANNFAGDVININNNSFIDLPEGVRICMRGGNDQWAEIVVGAANSQVTTFVNINLDPSHVCTT